MSPDHANYGPMQVQAHALSDLEKQELAAAKAIAQESLQSRYQKTGIWAGSTHFSDLWVRDACFASYGALALGDTEIVRTSLKTIFSNVRDDGLLPLRVGEKIFLAKFLGLNQWLPTPQGPTYIEDKYVSTAMDSNPLSITLFANYIKQSGDTVFLHIYFEALVSSFKWMIQQLDSDYLTAEGPYGGWADSIRRIGKVLYTNVLVVNACEAMQYLAQQAKRDDIVDLATGFITPIREAIQTQFWNGEFFDDWIRADGTRPTHFAVDGNTFAIYFNVATDTQKEQIIQYMEKTGLFLAPLVPVNAPDLAGKDIYTPFRFLGLADYHGSLHWLWLSCMDVMAQSSAGHHERAMQRLVAIAKKILEFDGVYEVYEPTGKPVQRWCYQSERTFAWSSGMFLWALGELKDE